MHATATVTRKGVGPAATVEGLTTEQLRDVLEVIAGRVMTLRTALCQDHDDFAVAVDMAVMALESIGTLADAASGRQIHRSALGWVMGTAFD